MNLIQYGPKVICRSMFTNAHQCPAGVTRSELIPCAGSQLEAGQCRAVNTSAAAPPVNTPHNNSAGYNPPCHCARNMQGWDQLVYLFMVYIQVRVPPFYSVVAVVSVLVVFA